MSRNLVTKTNPTFKSANHLSELKSWFSCKLANFLRFERSCGFALCKIVCTCEVSNRTVSRENPMHISQDCSILKSNR